MNAPTSIETMVHAGDGPATGMTRRFVRNLAACAILVLGAAAQAASGKSVPASLDKDLPKILSETHVPSVSVARIEGGKLSWAKAWGQQSPGVPATAETLYNVASLTKPVSAETVLRAASAGRLSLDEPMARYWVDPDIAGDKRHEALTPRSSLTHRTGFPNWRFLTNDRLVFERDPNTAVAYSGEGFEYLARFTERRTGVGFEALAEEVVFRPSGMTRTTYTRRDWLEGRIAVPGDAKGRPVEPSIRDAFLASDDLYTTASDYARFLVAAAARQGLSPAIANERERVLASRLESSCPPAKRAACPDAAGFGLGWDVAHFGTEHILWHTGADRGEWTMAFIDLKSGDGLVILTNSAVGWKTVLPILRRAGTTPRFRAFLEAIAP